MKLIFCPHCHDVVKLDFEWRKCKCERCGGMYKDKLNAVISEESICIGFDNFSLYAALQNIPEEGDEGTLFDAFIIPKKCKTVERE